MRQRKTEVWRRVRDKGDAMRERLETVRETEREGGGEG